MCLVLPGSISQVKLHLINIRWIAIFIQKEVPQNTPSTFARILTEMQSALSKRHHFWDGQSMAEAGPWGRLFWREMTVVGKINFPLWFLFSGVHWRCLWPRWLGELDSPDTEGVHPDCWVRAVWLTAPFPPHPSPLPYPLSMQKGWFVKTL